VDKLIAKAEVLLEALPFMRRFAGKTLVIKYGGAAMLDDRLRRGFAQDIVLLNSLGLHPVIVHGGGPQIGKALERLGIPTRFVRGMRVTDEAAMEVVEMVLAGQINKGIVADIAHFGGMAVGICGKDAGLIRASKMLMEITESGGKTETVDLGQVGKVEQVNPLVIEKLRQHDFIPVIAPIGFDHEGRSYNINADVAAGKIAEALKAEKLILMTDVAGILDANKELQPLLEIAEAERQIAAGSVEGGMVPKVECAIEALHGGVKQVHIIDGRVTHAVLLEIFTNRGVGTEVLASPPSGAGRA
jgi:acetylglutamate kinase